MKVHRNGQLIIRNCKSKEIMKTSVFDYEYRGTIYPVTLDLEKEKEKKKKIT